MPFKSKGSGGCLGSEPGVATLTRPMVQEALRPMLALSLWTPDRSATLAYAIGTHALNMLANVTLGSWFLAREGVSLRSLKSGNYRRPAPVRVPLAAGRRD